MPDELIQNPDGYLFVFPLMPHTIKSEFLEWANSQGCPATPVDDDPTNVWTFIYLPRIITRRLDNDAEVLGSAAWRMVWFSQLPEQQRVINAYPIIGDRLASDEEILVDCEVEIALVACGAINSFIKASNVKRVTGSRVLRLGK